MASAKEIRTQIKAIQNTGKITKAMEMVAASKMRKAQDRVIAARSYAEGVRRVVGNLMQSHPEYQHPFLVEREEVKKVGVIVVTTDKGLCGGLNTNALKATLRLMKSQTVDIEAFTIGRRGTQFMRRVGADMQGIIENISDTPELADILGVITLAMDRYLSGELDEVHLVYSEFVNTMTQEPQVMRLLPCPCLKKNIRDTGIICMSLKQGMCWKVCFAVMLNHLFIMRFWKTRHVSSRPVWSP